MTKKQRKIFYPTIFILGLFLMAWQITIFRNTIIDLKILIGIILVVGIITFLVDYKNYGKTYEYKGILLYFYSSMHYICGFGFMACSIFMLTNFYFADKNVKTESYEIIERTWIRGGTKYKSKRKKQPVFTIIYEGKKKELVFNSTYYDNMESYENVEFETKQGLFGFKILENKKLIE